MNTPLHAIEDKLIDLLGQLDEYGPTHEDESLREPPAELVQALLDLLDTQNEKINGIGGALRRMKRAADDCEAEIEELKSRRDKWDRKRKRLSEYVMDIMNARGVKKLEGSLVTLTMVDGRTKVGDVIDMELLPTRFVRIPPPPPNEPNRVAILEALTDGQEVPGATLAKGAPHLRVYR